MNTINIIKRTVGKACVFCLAMGAVLFASCVDDIKFGDAFLEKAPGIDVNLDTIFVNADNAERMLWSLYGAMHNPFTNNGAIAQSTYDTLSDINTNYNSWSQGYLEYYSANADESNQEGGFSRFRFLIGNKDDSGQYGIWGTIRKGWLFIENVDRVPDLTDDEKSQMKGEALIIMATRYFDAFRFFGGLPLMDHAYTPEETAPGRSTVEETIFFIDDLLQRAIDEPGLKWKIDDQETWAGRMSKAAAYGMRAKLWLYAASPLFNSNAPYREFTAAETSKNELHSWLGKYNAEYWVKCKDACEAFFNMNQQNGNYYALIQPTGDTKEDYRMAYRAGYWYRGNSEKIIEVHSNFNGNQSGTLWSFGQGDVRSFLVFAGAFPTLEYMEMFPMADGRNYPYKDIYGTDNPQNIDIMVDRDPRMYETLLVAEEEPMAQFLDIMPNTQLWRGGRMYTEQGIVNNFIESKPDTFPSGMSIYKFVLNNWEAFYNPINFAYLRMADMHLIYAEALAETGDLAGALREVNKVRARVGLADIEKANPTLNLTGNKDNLIAEIMRERACEFGYEDTRYHDLVRRKMIEQFTTPVHELFTWRKTQDGKKDERADTKLLDGEPWPHFIYEKRVSRVERKWTTPGGWDNKWLLEPLPRSEINKGYGLTQNPGWK